MDDRKKRRKRKKRIRTYVVQIKYVDSIFIAEMNKPSAARDKDLIQECLETLEYLHDSINTLSALEQSNPPRFPVMLSRVRYRRIALATAIVCVLVASTGVAQALGFRVWTALLHWDAGYLQVDYIPKREDPSTPNFEAGELFDLKEFPTINEAMEAAGFYPHFPNDLPFDLCSTTIRASRTITSANILIKYIGEYSLIYRATFVPEDSTRAVAVPDDKKSPSIYSVDSITFFISHDDESGWISVLWDSENIMYDFSTDMPADDVFSFIDMLYE